MKDFKELRVWTEAHHLTLKLYKETRLFPREEQYGLTSQISFLHSGKCRGGMRPEIGWRVDSLPTNRSRVGV